MKFWFDTEFYEDGRTIELISIGVVAEDGSSYYAETLDAKYLSKKSVWLMQNVLPFISGPGCSKQQIAKELIEFFGDKPEIWAYYASYDWIALCQLYGKMIDLPKGWPMFVLDVKQLCIFKGNPKLPTQAHCEHHALADAMWTKSAWEFLTNGKNI